MIFSIYNCQRTPKNNYEVNLFYFIPLEKEEILVGDFNKHAKLASIKVVSRENDSIKSIL